MSMNPTRREFLNALLVAPIAAVAATALPTETAIDVGGVIARAGIDYAIGQDVSGCVAAVYCHDLTRVVYYTRMHWREVEQLTPAELQHWLDASEGFKWEHA